MAALPHDLRSTAKTATEPRDEQAEQQARIAVGEAGQATLQSQVNEQPFGEWHIDLRTGALGTLVLLAVIAALYLAKTLLMPIVSAFVLGTMLAPAASWMQRFNVPRPLAAVLIVLGTFGAFALVLGLISAPLLEWTSRLPELAALLKARAAAFERPLAFLNEIRVYFGGSAGTFELPKIEWVQPTLEFLSPTFAELLLFFATLVLFLASWADLRRALILTFRDHNSRLRSLRMLNAIEESLGGYLLTVTMINVGVGVSTGLVCALAGMPNPAGLGALAATLNFIPYIGPIVTFVVLVAVGVITFPDVFTGVLPSLAFSMIAFAEGHFITPAIIGRRLALNALAVFVAIAFWTWLWGPIGAFLSSPILIVMLIVKQHLLPEQDTTFPDLQ